MSLVPLGHFQTTGRTLARMVAAGRITLEVLDQPPEEWPADRPYGNLARNWIKGNEAEWRQIADGYVAQAAVEVPMASPDPKDFAAVLPPSNTPPQQQNPITLETDDFTCPF